MTKDVTLAPAPIVDIGANLVHPSFADDLDEVIHRARQKNVATILVTGTSVEDSRQAAQLARQYPDVLYSTSGVHPHDAKHFGAGSRNDLRTIAGQPSVKAIGECGLDFNRMFSDKTEQIEAFEQQIELAIELQLPLFLHERDAHKTQWEILANYRDHFGGGVIHCFTGSKQQAFRYLDLDLYIGITGWICDERRGYHLHEFVGDIPLQRLLIETDAPYLMPRVKPKPAVKSSRRNEPCTLPHVLAEISSHSPYDSETIARATTTNAKTLFAIED